MQNQNQFLSLQDDFDKLLDRKELKKFKMNTKYVHNRSEGLTRRTNKGTYLQTMKKKKGGDVLFSRFKFLKDN